MGASLNNPAHVVLAIMRDVLQPADQIQAVTDLKSIRQGTAPAEEFLQYEFEPMVYVAHPETDRGYNRGYNNPLGDQAPDRGYNQGHLSPR